MLDRYSQDEVFDSAQVVVMTDIEYGNAPHFLSGVDIPLLMDVYMPDPEIDNIENRPLIVLMHGGAFMIGNKSQMSFVAREYAKRGYVAVSVGYRLGWGCTATDFLSACVLCGGLAYDIRRATYSAVQDVRAALRFLVDNSETYGIDPEWLFAGGESAGSITALHTAFWEQAEADLFVPGFADDVGGLDDSGNELIAEFEIKAVINKCGAVNATSVLENNSVPVISFHDDLDCVVPYNCGPVLGCACATFYGACGSQSIHTSLAGNGICSELHTVQVSLNHCSFPSLPLVQKASCFLKRVMCDVCVSFSNTDPYSLSACSNLESNDPTCPSDINGDSVVNVSDLLIFLTDFGTNCE
jgi:hypothetical protein